MQQTTSYQLNQWEGTDRILRTDFNADNAKIDAAMTELREEMAAAAAACPIQKLLSTRFSTASNRQTINVSGLPLADYRELWIYVYFSQGTQADFIDLLLNDVTEYPQSNQTYPYFCKINTDSLAREKTQCRFQLFLDDWVLGRSLTGCRSGSGSTLQRWARESELAWSDLAPSDLRKLVLQGHDGKVIGSGTRVEILGIRT